GVDDVQPELQRAAHRGGIERVGRRVVPAEVGPDPERGEPDASRSRTEVSWRRGARLAEARGAFGSGAARQHPAEACSCVRCGSTAQRARIAGAREAAVRAEVPDFWPDPRERKATARCEASVVFLEDA